MSKQLEAYYGLPSDVIFCKKCVMSNQRPTSTVEINHTENSKKQTLKLDESGICDACLVAEKKKNIDWNQREQELSDMLAKHRRTDGSHDCIVPGSGGKDSSYQAHVLKYKYGMNPLTVTWPPILYTDYGYKNWQNWINVGGFDNLSYFRNGKVLKLLTKLSIENIFHPFQTFILGQKNWPIKLATQLGINLVMYGENEAEYGNPVADDSSSLRSKSYHTYKNLDNVYLGGISIGELKEKYGLTLADIKPYLPPTDEDFSKNLIEVRYLGYYLKWNPQECYYYSVENTGFKARPYRTQGSYSKYHSLDDKIDDFHFYTTFLKFGIGRASFDASHEIRSGHLNREEACLLVNKYDGEFPNNYFMDVMNYIEMKPERFLELCGRARSPHLWGKDDLGEWKLRHNVMGNGLDDKRKLDFN